MEPHIFDTEQIEQAIERMRWLAAWVDDNAVSEEHQAIADAWTELDKHFCNAGPLPAEWQR